MKNSGLVSISFRNKTTDELISMCRKAGLEYIEWGSDVHCPAGDIECARELYEKSKSSGLITYCYGSYFRVGITDCSEFEAYCLTAKALGARCIRVWAYNKPYSECSAVEITHIEESAKTIFAVAKKHDLCISFEYHRGSLTESAEGALKLFNSVPKENLRIHWQPNPQITAEENLKELQSLPRIDLIHVFAWTREGDKDIRHPLYDHHITWRDLYINAAKEMNPECIFELEFFKDDTEEQFFKDADTLNDIL